MAFKVTMNDVNPNMHQKMEIFPQHRESRIEISQRKGNPSLYETVAIFWFMNEDMKKFVKTLEDLS